VDFEKVLEKIHEEKKKGEANRYTNEKSMHFLHSLAIAAEALVEIESEKAKEKK